MLKGGKDGEGGPSRMSCATLARKGEGEVEAPPGPSVKIVSAPRQAGTRGSFGGKTACFRGWPADGRGTYLTGPGSGPIGGVCLWSWQLSAMKQLARDYPKELIAS